MVWYNRTLIDVSRSKAKEKLFSRSVPGNPIGCEIPETFEGKDMEISVTWGISPGYTVTASLVNPDLDEVEEGSIEVGRFQSLQELEKNFPELFPMEGTFYIM